MLKLRSVAIIIAIVLTASVVVASNISTRPPSAPDVGASDSSAPVDTDSTMSDNLTLGSSGARTAEYTGRLDGEDGPITGTYSMTVDIYSSKTGGRQVWSTHREVVRVEGGRVEMILGSGERPLPESVTASGRDYWVELTVEGQTVEPRDRLDVETDATEVIRDKASSSPAVSDGEIAALRGRVSAVERQVEALRTDGGSNGGKPDMVFDTITRRQDLTESQEDSLKTQVNGIQSTVNDHENRLTDVENKLDAFTRTTINGYDSVVFGGVNVHIRNEADGDGDVKTGSTISDNGVGNLIVGYNEANEVSDTKSGSHNVVIGANHHYNCIGSLITGQDNKVTKQSAAAVGGASNSVTGMFGCTCGGTNNTAGGGYAAATGGSSNTASFAMSTVSGGKSNTASGQYSTSVGGRQNSVSGNYANVSGGRFNEAAATYSVVTGGGGDSGSSPDKGNHAEANYSAIVGGRKNETTAGGAGNEANAVVGGTANTASGELAVVTSGQDNTASGQQTTAVGGDGNTASGSNAVVAGGNDNTAGQSLAMVSGADAASTSSSKEYIDGGGASAPTLKEVLNAGNDADGKKITNLAAPVNGSDAATKDYVDANAGNGGGGEPISCWANPGSTKNYCLIDGECYVNADPTTDNWVRCGGVDAQTIEAALLKTQLPEYWYSGGNDNETTKLLKSQAAAAWSYGSNEVQSLSVNPSGQTFVGQDNGVISKISEDGTLIWRKDFGSAQVRDNALDSSSNVYLIHGQELFKLTTNGSQKWRYYNSAYFYAVAVDSSGNVYTSGNQGYIYKIKPDGTKAWQINYNNNDWDEARGLFVGPNDNLYAVGEDRLYKYDSTGTKVWSRDSYDSTKVALTPSNHIVVNTGNEGLRKFGSDGTDTFWDKYYGEGYIRAMAVDSEGRIFASTSRGRTLKISKGGGLLDNNNQGGAQQAVGVGPNYNVAFGFPTK